MLAQTIREFMRAVPFRPFVIRMNDGRRFVIRHPDYVSVSPQGSRVFVYHPDDSETHLSGILIASVEPRDRPGSRHSHAA